MKRLKLMSAITLSLMISFTACEKEGNDILPDAAQNSNTTSSKSSATPTKSGEFPDGYWDNLQQFIFDVMEENELSDMEVEKALYYTESAKHWELTNSDITEFQYRRLGDELSFNVSSLYDSLGVQFITKDNLRNLNNQIIISVTNQASTMADTLNDSLYINEIDLDWDIGTGNAIVKVNVLYGLNYFPVAPPTCGLQSRRAGVRAGCHPNFPPQKRNGHEEVDKLTSPLACKTWDRKLNCSSSNLIINIKRSAFLEGTDCGFNLFNGSENTCYPWGTAYGDHDDVRLAWNNRCSMISNVNEKLKTCFFDGVPGPTYFYQVVHRVQYITADCFDCSGNPFNICPSIAKPNLWWETDGGKKCLLPPCPY